MGGYRRSVLEGERDWLLARLEEKPDLTIRALVLELSDRGVKAGDWSVWAFLKREGLSFKKNPARRRAGPAGRGQEAGAVEAASAPD
jgi:transposase